MVGKSETFYQVVSPEDARHRDAGPLAAALAMAAMKYWVVVPAAGSSRRMAGAGLPKQYLQLAGRSVIEWSLAPFLERTDCERIVVVLAADDRRWRKQSLARDPRVVTATGGAERVDSVRAGLRALAARRSRGRLGAGARRGATVPASYRPEPADRRAR